MSGPFPRRAYTKRKKKVEGGQQFASSVHCFLSSSDALIFISPKRRDNGHDGPRVAGEDGTVGGRVDRRRRGEQQCEQQHRQQQRQRQRRSLFPRRRRRPRPQWTAAVFFERPAPALLLHSPQSAAPEVARRHRACCRRHSRLKKQNVN